MAERIDHVERAHLRDARGFSPPIHRYAVPADLADVVRRFWMPVWSLPPGERTVQRVLQYPVCQVVVADDYAHLVGPHTGLATKELAGSGWAAGAMLQPAAGALLHGGPMTGLRDHERDLDEIDRIETAPLIAAVRQAMRPDPADPARHAEAARLLGEALAPLSPMDDEGLLVNAVVAYVEHDPAVRRVGQIAEKFAVSERSLQRILARRVGLSPKWLVQRRRLQEAAERLRVDEQLDLARVAVELGYADQAHFSHDWRAVTGTTPAGFATEPRPFVE
jgi:AraC-like DNA-binding protein